MANGSSQFITEDTCINCGIGVGCAFWLLFQNFEIEKIHFKEGHGCPSTLFPFVDPKVKEAIENADVFSVDAGTIGQNS
jgi:predicted DNA-binding helix-hairpin-helix protein